MARRLIALVGAISIALGVGLIVAGTRVAPAGGAAAGTASPTARVSSALASATSAPTIAPIPPGYRITIARLGIDLPITEGDRERDTVVQQTPENYAFHFPGSAIPGTNGNTYLYAHARRGMFLALWDARVGDLVVITTPSGATIRYLVREIHPRVPPEDVSWLEPATSERLTLQTSTGPNPKDPRFVVVATPA